MALSQRKSRDTGLHRLSTVEGDLAGLVQATVNGFGIQVELTYGWLYAKRRADEKLDVVVVGLGGGLCWRQAMTRVGLRNRILDATPDDPRVRRGPITEVWPRD